MKRFTERHKQFAFKFKKWGGSRKGSGRPNKSGTVSHGAREIVAISTPLHISLKLKEKLPTIRTYTLLKEFKYCLKLAQKQGLFIIHYSIQHNHIHMIAEAFDNRSLALGMRSLAGRFAKIIRKHSFFRGFSEEKGSVFNGRYHLHVLKTSIEVKNALKYVLLNYSKHTKLIQYMDDFSSARFFTNWKELLGKKIEPMLLEEIRYWRKSVEQDENLQDGLSIARSWFLCHGWKALNLA